jgi:DNA-binding transcriptional ArsR family regulator
MSNSRILDATKIAAVLKALSNPNRLQIFRQLVRCCQPGARCQTDAESVRRCVGDLGRDLRLAPSTVSHHIKELRHAGLIRVERRGQNIQCWIDPEVVRSLADFFRESWVACSGSDEAAA